MSVLMIDVGGSNAKLMISENSEMRKIPSGQHLSAEEMVKRALDLASDWEFDRISIGFPGLIQEGKPFREPLNLGGGWVDFDYARKFGRPVRFMNDASMQALGNYREGRMLFIGFGTSTGTSLIVDDVVVPMEIGMLKLTRSKRFMHQLTDEALQKDGQQPWMKTVVEAIELLQDVFHPDDTVIGGGNAKLIDPVPSGCRLVTNRTVYNGACRLWEDSDLYASPWSTSWRIHRNPNTITVV
ncbi:ROK family protein [soil metagenome]